MTTPNWTYKIRKIRNFIQAPISDANGKPVYENGEPKTSKFVVYRYRLILHSEKYATVLEYNISPPNRAKSVVFFTNRETKKQYLPFEMKKCLSGWFTATEAGIIVSECKNKINEVA